MLKSKNFILLNLKKKLIKKKYLLKRQQKNTVGKPSTKLNNFGFAHFTHLDLQNNRKIAQLEPNVTSTQMQEQKLFNEKKYPLKNLKKINKQLKFYLKGSFYDLEERDKIETNLFYMKSFFILKEYNFETIKTQLEIDKNYKNQDKTKKFNKNLMQPYLFNFINYQKTNVTAFTNPKDAKKLFNFNTLIKKKTAFLLKKLKLIQLFFNNQKLEPIKYFNLFSTLKAKNYRVYANINSKKEVLQFNKENLELLRKQKLLNFNQILKNFYRQFFRQFQSQKVKNFKKKYFRFLHLPQFKEFKKNYKFFDNNIKQFRISIINFFINLKIKRLNITKFKHLIQLFTFNKSVSKLSNLIFEYKPNLNALLKNYIRKKKNLQLKILQKYYPDNIFDILQKKKRNIRSLNLIREGFKNLNDNFGFINSKLKKNRKVLINKKNLFFFNTKNKFFLKNCLNFNNFKKNRKLSKFRQQKELLHDIALSSPIFLGQTYYKRRKARRYQKKTVNRKNLNLLNKLFFKKPKKQHKIRRKNLAFEYTSSKFVKLLRQNFDGKSKFFVDGKRSDFDI